MNILAGVLWVLGSGFKALLLCSVLALSLAFCSAALYVSHRIAFPPWHDPRPGSSNLTQKRMPEAWAGFTLDPCTSLGLQFESVAFRSRSGRWLRGWWVPAPVEPPAPTGVVCVHGGGRDRRAFMRQSVLFHRRGWSVLLFDCTGHGTSDARRRFPLGAWPGAAITYGTLEWSDVIDALRYTYERIREQAQRSAAASSVRIRVALVGTSQGAVSAAYAAAYLTRRFEQGDGAACPPVDVLVLENPFTSPLALFAHLASHVAMPVARYGSRWCFLRHVVRFWVMTCTTLALFRTGNVALTCRMLAKACEREGQPYRCAWWQGIATLGQLLSVSLSLSSSSSSRETPPAGGFDSVAEAVQALKCPVFFMHGMKDWIVPYKHSVQLYKAANEPKELWLSAEAGHTMMYHCEPDTFETRVCGFMERYLRGSM
jgi:pimeloyl-ACP methyl ester carboxylesterase